MQYHPDRNNGDKGAEEQFKEVGEAYSVLSDPQKRQRYDAFGHVADGAQPDFGNFSFDSAFDLFDMFFGGGGRRRAHTGPQRGDDLRMNIEITFEEAVFGAKRTVEVPRATHVHRVQRLGRQAGHERRPVRDLLGAAARCAGRCSRSSARSPASPRAPRCHGEGQVIAEPCTVCRGQGRIQGRHTVEVTIPAGVDDDVTLRLTGEGEPGPRGGPSGDLYLGFRVKPHPNLVRRGQDLLYELPVIGHRRRCSATPSRSTTVDGEHPVEVPPGTQPGRQIKMHGLGVPHVRTGRRGDLICVVRVVVPSHLSHQERALYEQLGGREGKPAEVKKGFFDSLRDAFRG